MRKHKNRKRYSRFLSGKENIQFLPIIRAVRLIKQTLTRRQDWHRCSKDPTTIGLPFG